MNAQKDLQRCIERYISGKATAEEIRFVENYYQYLDKSEDILDKANSAELKALEDENLQKLLAAIQQPVQKPKRLVVRYSIAAAILCILGFGIIYLTKKQPLAETQKVAVSKKEIDILPGKDKAILTLSDGRKIVLDDSADAEISELENLTVTKTKSGQLIYKANAVYTKTGAIAYHTIETTRGGQYQVILPDGTKVWLNASSSLTYPIQFSEDERKVALTGEAYFEVAKMSIDKIGTTEVRGKRDGGAARVPFLVKTGNQQVEVLGTHFNVNGYMDEQVIKTTLVEGSVKVSNLTAQKSQLIKPGQQSLIGNHSLLIKDVDTDDETAWKDGLFRFNNSNLKNILYQLERWYDIKIDYTRLPNRRFNGMISRKVKLSEVLNMLELTGNIDFKIDEERQLKVISK